jgi:c-di-AMP phosphodiesterase-like protein
MVLAVLMIADVIVSALMIYKYDKVEACTVLISAVLLIAAFAAVIALCSRNIMRYISKMNTQLESSAAEYLVSLPAPAAVIDQTGMILWYNSIFGEKIAKGHDVYGTDLQECFSVNIDSLCSSGFAVCVVNESYYRISAEKFAEGETTCIVLYFHDETEYFNLKKRYDEKHPTVIIINIDNYDDIMQNAKESDKARTSVETEQLIENFMNGSNGVVKKTSPNVFYAILENQHINQIIDEKFKILDSARNIKINDKTPLTLSIGVGYGADSLAQSEKIARQCLDMALGRGGDQAVVKTDGGYRFFGGISKGVEKKSRSKTRIIANTLRELILNSHTVYIMGHRFGDLDSVGSAVGLAGAVRLLGKEVYIAVDAKKNLAPHLIDMVRNESGEDFFVSPVAAADNISDNDLLIIVDTHSKDFIESPELYRNAKSVVVIDHHRKTVNFIDNTVIFHHEPYASSASEMVAELIQYFSFEGDAVLESYYADAMLAGITLDTKNFVMRTGVRTFEAAAFLRKLGADTVNVKLLFSNSIESYRRKTQIVASAKIHNSCAIASADFRSDDIRLVAPQAADVNASFVIYRTGDTINISARSLGAMNVQVIMEHLGGGGHQTMAAAQINDVSVQEAAGMLMRAIDECTG